MTDCRRKFGGTFRIALFASLVTFSSFAARTASAQTTYYWNNNGPDSFWNDASLDWMHASGSLATEFWSDGSNNNIAIFAGTTAGTVTLGATVDPGTIDFNTTGYTIADPSRFRNQPGQHRPSDQRRLRQRGLHGHDQRRSNLDIGQRFAGHYRHCERHERDQHAVDLGWIAQCGFRQPEDRGQQHVGRHVYR